jgi:hypothetical protein
MLHDVTPRFIAEPVVLGPGLHGHAYALVLRDPPARCMRLSFAAADARHAPHDLLCRLPARGEAVLPIGIIPGARWSDAALARHLDLRWPQPRA